MWFSFCKMLNLCNFTKGKIGINFQIDSLVKQENNREEETVGNWRLALKTKLTKKNLK